MKSVLLLPALLLAAMANAAPVDAAKSSVKFVFTQMNVPVEGQFKKFNADVAFDAAKPETAKVTVNVELAGADAGNSDANVMMQAKEWFDGAHFPRATFTSSQFKALGNGKFQAVGQFSLKGRTAALTVPFTARAEGNGQWLEGAFPLSRLAWKVGEGEWADVGTVADAVQIKFKLFVAK
ncbi:YceI family protein [Chitinimonas sp.]|uniref:YceI family protein n=1 Tax=Chitinimonas sp. TaxID=1934313 RepID=UPI0035AEF16E